MCNKFEDLGRILNTVFRIIFEYIVSKVFHTIFRKIIKIILFLKTSTFSICTNHCSSTIRSLNIQENDLNRNSLTNLNKQPMYRTHWFLMQKSTIKIFILNTRFLRYFAQVCKFVKK